MAGTHLLHPRESYRKTCTTPERELQEHMYYSNPGERELQEHMYYSNPGEREHMYYSNPGGTHVLQEHM